MKDLDNLIAHIRETHRWRKDHVREQTALTLRIKSICMRLCEGEIPERDKLYNSMFNGQAHELTETALAIAAPFIQARQIIEDNRKQFDKLLANLAKDLPAHDFIDETTGVDWLSYGQVIGEAGNLTTYDKGLPAIYKRLGLALVGGRAQGRPGKGATKEVWIEHGYSPERRAVTWNIGQNFVRAKKKDQPVGEYRAIYDWRKDYETKTTKGITKGHAHNRAMRYATKRFIEDLYVVWCEELLPAAQAEQRLEQVYQWQRSRNND
jgi:hypothetical protein